MTKSNNRKHQFLGLTVLLALVLLMPLPASPAEVASASITPSGLTVTPMVDHNGGVLVVAGMDNVIRREFGPGERPSFEPVAEGGGPLPDGLYKWELRLNSTQLTAVDDGTNGRDPKVSAATRRTTRGRVGLTGSGRRFQLPTQSGAFTVRFGGIVDPNTTEGTDTGAATQ